jgi:hypothetical protein
MADPADIILNLNNDQAGQVVQQQVLAGAQTTLAFKVEQSKIPEFLGTKRQGYNNLDCFPQENGQIGQDQKLK